MEQDEVQALYAQVEEHYELMGDQNVPVNAKDMAEYRRRVPPNLR